MLQKGYFKLSLVFLLTFIFFSCSLLVNTSETFAAEYNLSLATFAPSTHLETTEVLEPWVKKIKKATDGKVEVTIYAGETLLAADRTYEGVVSGIADIGFSDYGYNMSNFPMIMTLFLGGLDYGGSKVASYVTRDFINEFNPKEIQDTELMFAYCTTPGAIMAKSPIRTAKDMQGMQFKISGKGKDNVNAIAGSPVAMPMSQAVEGLNKGVIDGVISSPEILKGWNMTEVVDYITIAPFMYNAVHYVTMNKETWNSFPADIQDAIKEVNEDVFKNIASGIFNQFCRTGIGYAQQHGDEIITLDKAEKQEWLNKLETTQQDHVKMLNEKGLPGEEALKRVKELIKKYNEEIDTYLEQQEI